MLLLDGQSTSNVPDGPTTVLVVRVTDDCDVRVADVVKDDCDTAEDIVEDDCDVIEDAVDCDDVPDCVDVCEEAEFAALDAAVPTGVSMDFLLLRLPPTPPPTAAATTITITTAAIIQNVPDANPHILLLLSPSWCLPFSESCIAYTFASVAILSEG